ATSTMAVSSSVVSGVTRTSQGQYNRGRNAVATGVAARMNGNETIFISDRRVETSGGIYASRIQQLGAACVK
ncbi:ERF2, partial [Symbiodinium pilosum]